LQPDSEREKVARPKLTWPLKAWTVLRSAHFASLMRVASMLQLFFGAVLGQEWLHSVVNPGAAQATMLPEVSTTIMK